MRRQNSHCTRFIYVPFGFVTYVEIVYKYVIRFLITKFFFANLFLISGQIENSSTALVFTIIFLEKITGKTQQSVYQ